MSNFKRLNCGKIIYKPERKTAKKRKNNRIRRLLCRLGFHRWERWEMQIQRYRGFRAVIRCKHCLKIKKIIF